MKEIVYILIFLVLVLGLGYGYLKKGVKISVIKEGNIVGDISIEQKVLQFDLTSYTDRGTKRWQVKGKSANVLGQIIELRDIVAATYGQENGLSLKADEGTYNKGLNKIHLEKNVIITTDDGGQVLADSMDWDSKNNVITTDSPVKIEREAITLWGKGVRGEPELRKVRFAEEIKIEMDDGATVMTCDGPLDIDYEKNLAVFNNNVKIVDKKGEVTSNRLDAYLNPETKAIVKAIAKGDVKILRGDNYSQSDEAIYLADEHKVILTGRPEITFYPDEKLDASLFGVENE